MSEVSIEMPGLDTVPLEIYYVTLKSRAKDSVQVYAKLSDTVESFINHFERSFDLPVTSWKRLPNQIHLPCKKLFKEYNKISGPQKQIRLYDDLNHKMTLERAGIRPEQILYLQGSTSLRNRGSVCHKITVQIQIPEFPGKQEEILNVMHNANVGDVKHKIQDKTGIPHTDQLLYSSRNKRINLLSDSTQALSVVGRLGYSNYVILKLKQGRCSVFETEHMHGKYVSFVLKLIFN